MLFRKKKEKKCSNCDSPIDKKFSYCPYCGKNIVNFEELQRDYGLLGKTDAGELPISVRNFGIFDKAMASLINNMIKHLEKEMQQTSGSGTFPNGIKIKISGPIDENPKGKKPKPLNTHQRIAEEQIKKMGELPRELAKVNVKRIGNKVIYELFTPGLSNINDVFISKLESGYEVKAIGNKKVYVNAIRVDLPIVKYTISNSRLLIEFALQDE